MAPARRSAEATHELRETLLEAAERILNRDGAPALTMRALAAEAGCSVGLPYKVFGGRGELIVELIHAEFVRLSRELGQLVAQAGTGTMAASLGRYAELLLGSPAIALGDEVAGDPALAEEINARAGETGVIHSVETVVADYLAAEARLGRVAPDVDTRAFGFLIAGAVHNLLVSGEGYPRPSLTELKTLLASVARTLSPQGS